ncbi:MAG: sulfatase-like hydrolase/transferase [Pseudomonadota bacterium]
MRLRNPLATFAIEALLWLVPAGLFLRTYLERAAAPMSAAYAHLALVLIVAGSVAATRALLHRVVPRSGSNLIGALLTATALWLLWAYYLVAIAGFGAWGRLVSWGLIATYLWRATELIAVLGAGAYAIVAAAAICFIGLSWLVHKIIVKHDWAAPTPARPSCHGLRLAGAALFLCAASLFFWRFVNFPPIESGEPVASTFNTHLLAQRRQTHHNPASRRLAQQEDDERAAYVASSGVGPTNVVLVMVDALRAKSMGAYGYARNTTPYLSQLAREGKISVVPHAYSVCAESSCGILGILASRYVHQAVARPITLIEVLARNGLRHTSAAER